MLFPIQITEFRPPSPPMLAAIRAGICFLCTFNCRISTNKLKRLIPNRIPDQNERTNSQMNRAKSSNESRNKKNQNKIEANCTGKTRVVRRTAFNVHTG